MKVSPSLIAIGKVALGVSLSVGAVLLIPSAQEEDQPPPPAVLSFLVGATGLGFMGCGIWEFWKAGIESEEQEVPPELLALIEKAEKAQENKVIEQQASVKQEESQEQNLEEETLEEIQEEPESEVEDSFKTSQEKTYPSSPPTVVANSELNPYNPPSVTLPLEKRKQWLWEVLERETPLLLMALEAAPLLVFGGQRSWKSTLVKIICLLRQLFVCHEIEVCDPDAQDTCWPDHFEVWGANGNYTAIGRRIERFYEQLNNPDGVNRTRVWDEFSTYVEEIQLYEDVKKNAELTGAFMKKVLTRSQKKGEFPILVAHGDTSAYTGGDKGSHESKRQGLARIKMIPKRLPTGRAVPTGRGIATGLSVDDFGEPEEFRFQIPEWLFTGGPDYILRLFPELSATRTPIDPLDSIGLDDAGWSEFIRRNGGSNS